MAHQFTTSYLADALAVLRTYKRQAEAAMEQAADEELNRTLDPESNSIATIVKHLAGNMRSRWTDFLTSDGEKPDRRRDTEFEAAPANRAELTALWEAGWKCVFEALEPLSDADLGRTVTIRGEPHAVPLALERSLGHTCYHVGQIVQVARVHAGEKWNTLTIPRGGSQQFNKTHWGQPGKSHP